MGAYEELKKIVKDPKKALRDQKEAYDRMRQTQKAEAAAKRPPEPPKEKLFFSIENAEGALRNRGRAMQQMPSRKKGGEVKVDGPNFLHKGERVLTKEQTKKLDSKPAVKKSLGVGKGAGKKDIIKMSTVIKKAGKPPCKKK